MINKMTFMNELKTIIMISGITLLLDYVYLSSFSKQFGIVFKEIQGSKLNVRLISALCVYTFIIFTVYYFGFVKKLSNYEIGILGFVIYGIYEGTNHATLKNWPLWMVVIDTLWGGLFFFSVNSLTKLLLTLI